MLNRITTAIGAVALSVTSAFAGSAEDAKATLRSFDDPSVSSQSVRSGQILLEQRSPAVSNGCHEENLTYAETTTNGVTTAWIRSSALDLDGNDVVSGPKDGKVHVQQGAGYLVYDDGKPVPVQWSPAQGGPIGDHVDYVDVNIDNGCTQSGGGSDTPPPGGGDPLPPDGCEPNCGASVTYSKEAMDIIRRAHNAELTLG